MSAIDAIVTAVAEVAAHIAGRIVGRTFLLNESAARRIGERIFIVAIACLFLLFAILGVGQ